MTTKAKMSNLESYQELSIQITTLSLKIDKVLELLNKPEVTTNHPLLRRCFGQDIEIQPFKITAHEHLHVGVGKTQELNNPPQWPNESRTDYMKRIGQYNEAQSCDEYYGETYK